MTAGSVVPQIPGFRILRALGWGGVGVVYAAVDEDLGRTVALKTVPASGKWERFRREMVALTRLQHPGFVTLYKHGRTPDLFYYSMELVRGKPLSTFLQAMRERGKLPRGQRLRKRLALVHGVARALVYAHERGVFHRDLTPSNILLPHHGRPKVIDFGLAELAGQPTMTTGHSVFGTPRYLSPEKLLGKPGPEDARQDIYSLGVLLYELITFSHPYPHDTLEELVRRVERALPVAPRRENPYLSRDLENVMLKAVAREPEDRYATMVEFASDVERAGSGLKAEAPRSTLLARLLWALRRDPTLLGVLTWAFVFGAILAAGYAIYSLVRG